MTLIISRFGFVRPLRSLQLGRTSPSHTLRRFYNPYYVHPLQEPQPEEQTATEKEEDVEGIDDSYESADDRLSHNDSDRQLALRQQLELRSPVDALRRRFYGPTAVIRSYRITRRLIKQLNARQNPAVSQIRKNVADTEQPADEQEATGPQQPLPWSELRSVIEAQLGACKDAAEIMRVYTIALRNPFSTQALREIQLDPHDPQAWFNRFVNHQNTLRVLNTILRRLHSGAAELHPHIKVLLPAAVRCAALHRDYEAIANLVTLWRKELDWSPKANDRPSFTSNIPMILESIIRGIRRLRRTALGPAFDPDSVECRRLQHVVNLLHQCHPPGPLHNHLLILGDSKSLNRWAIILSLAHDRRRVLDLEQAYLAHHGLDTWGANPPATSTACAFAEALFRVHEPGRACAALRSTALSLSDQPAHFHIFLALQDTSAMPALLKDDPADVRARWAAQQTTQRAELEAYALNPLLAQLVGLERALGLVWDPATRSHAMHWGLQRAWAVPVARGGAADLSGKEHPLSLPGLLVAELGADYAGDVLDKAAELADAHIAAFDGADEYAAWLAGREGAEDAELRAHFDAPDDAEVQAVAALLDAELD